MKIILIFITLFFIAVSAHAENSLEGTWVDKTKTSFIHQYEFNENHDFIYTVIFSNGYKSIKTGVWDSDSRCTLKIYLDADDCCYDVKFIADNLVMTKNTMYSSSSRSCGNKVLIRKPINLLKVK